MIHANDSGPGARVHGAPDHGPTTPHAKLEHLSEFGEVSEIEPDVVTVLHRSGQRTRWIRAMGGYWRRVDQEAA